MNIILSCWLNGVPMKASKFGHIAWWRIMFTSSSNPKGNRIWVKPLVKFIVDTPGWSIYGKTGKGYLWQGRFSSYPMDKHWLLKAAAYVELNPVKAGMVKKPGTIAGVVYMLICLEKTAGNYPAGKTAFSGGWLENLPARSTSWFRRWIWATWANGQIFGWRKFYRKSRAFFATRFEKKPGPKGKGVMGCDWVLCPLIFPNQHTAWIE